MSYVVFESVKLKKIALTRRVLVIFGAVSTDIYFLVLGVLILTLRSFFQPGTVLPIRRLVMTTVLVNPVLPQLGLLTLVIRFTTLGVSLVLSSLVFTRILSNSFSKIFLLNMPIFNFNFCRHSRVLGAFSCHSERECFKFTQTFFKKQRKR